MCCAANVNCQTQNGYKSGVLNVTCFVEIQWDHISIKQICFSIMRKVSSRHLIACCLVACAKYAPQHSAKQVVATSTRCHLVMAMVALRHTCWALGNVV